MVKRALIDSYSFLYAYRMLKNFLRSHDPHFNPVLFQAERSFVFSDDIRKEWYDFFGVNDESIHVPFTYYTRNSALVFFDLLEHNDIPFKNVLHIKTETMMNEHPGFIVGHEYRLSYSCYDIVKVKDNRLAIIGEVQVYDNDRMVYQTRETFFVIRISESAVETFKPVQHHEALPEAVLQNISSKVPLLNAADPSVKKIGIQIRKNDPQQYGKLSGDFNPIHTSKVCAKMIGKKSNFVQGMYISNMVMSKLITSGMADKLTKMEMLYCNHIYPDQTISLHVNDSGYLELVDKSGLLLSVGSYAK